MDRNGQKKACLDVRVLGASGIFLGGRVLARAVFDKPYTLFLYLVIERKRHRREDLVRLFWPGMDDATGRQNLSSTIYILKKRLGKSFVLEGDRIYVWWAGSGSGQDPVDLCRLLDDTPPSGCDSLHEPSVCSGCRERLRGQLSEYRGDFLEDADIPSLPDLNRWVESVRRRAKERASHLDDRLSGALPVASCDATGNPDWELRQVTILCIQTDPGMGHDVGDLFRRLMNGRNVAESVLRNRGGWVAPFHGAFWLSYFGFPLASEKAARQAVRAALEIFEKAGFSGKDLPPLRIGIHTGEVVCDLMRGEPDVLGSATRTAVMAADESGPGEILVTDGTLELVRPFFWSEFHGELLHGKSRERIGLSRILGESEGPSFGELFVGRRAELKRLLGLWREAVRGSVRVAWITGEPGIGKSRLVRAFARSIGQSGVVRSLYCFPECANTPWFPVVRLFWTLLGLDLRKTKDQIRYIAEKYLLSLNRPVEEELPVFLRFLLGEGDFPPLLPEKITLLIENLLGGLLEGRLEKSPALFIVEDFCWADQATVGLIEKILGKISCGPLMMVFTSRSSGHLRSSFSAGPDEEISLSELDADDSRQLVEELSRSALSPEQVGEVLRLGSGVPLFLEESVKIRLSGGRGPTLSSGIRELLAARIDDLGESKELAQVAACLGLEFPADLLEEVFLAGKGGESLAEIRSLIDLLFKKGILKESASDPAAGLGFRHAIFRDALLLSLPDPLRRSIHRRTVEVIKSRFPERATREPECLAEHLMQGEMFDEAFGVWVLAAQNAVSIGALGDANSHLEKALGIVRMDSSGSESAMERELELLLAIGPVSRALHGYGAERVDEIYRRASGLCERLGSGSRTFPVLYSMWASAITRFGPEEAMKWASELISASRKSGRTEERVRASHAMGSTLSWTERISESERCLKDALSEAAGFYDFRRSESLSRYAEEPIVGLMCDLSRILWFQGHPAEAANWVDRAIGRSMELNHPLSWCLALSSSILVHFFSGEPEKMEASAKKLGELSERHGFGMWVHSATFSLGWAMGNREGLDRMKESRRVIEADLPGYATLYSLFEADGALRAGYPDEALVAIARGRASGMRLGIRILDPELMRLEGEARLLLEPECPGHAERLFREALAKSLFVGAFGLALKAALSLARVSPGEISQVRMILDRVPDSPGIPYWDHGRRLCRDFPGPPG